LAGVLRFNFRKARSRSGESACPQYDSYALPEQNPYHEGHEAFPGYAVSPATLVHKYDDVFCAMRKDLIEFMNHKHLVRLRVLRVLRGYHQRLLFLETCTTKKFQDIPLQFWA